MVAATNGWQEVVIGQLGRVVTGKTPPTKNPELFGSQYPFITPTDIQGQSRIAHTERALSDEGFKKQNRLLLPTGAVCFTCIGSIGKICMTTQPSFTSQQINSIVVDTDNYDNRYVYYLLREQADRIKSLSGGAATPIISKGIFSDIKISVPPLSIQRKIASVLSTYDDLIENNSRRIQILKEMAQKIYREWFVHFRFPGPEVGMVDSELGQIPKGWKVVPVAHFGQIITGKTPSKKMPQYYGGYMPFIKTPDMHSNMFCTHAGEYLSQSGVESQKTKTLPANSICVSCIGTVGIVSITSQPSQTNQQINSLVLRDLSEREFLYFSLLGLKDTIMRYGSTGATMANLSKGKFESLRILCPTEEVTASFHDIVSPLFEQIKILQLKQANLQRTRNLLLPKLILGELTLRHSDATGER